MNSRRKITITVIYCGRKEDITCTAGADYEDFISKATERFQIPTELKNFAQFTNKYKYSFEKDSFGRFLNLCPTPNPSLLLRIDYNALVKKLSANQRGPMLKMIVESRKSAIQNRPAPISHSNCQYMAFNIVDLPDEPSAKRPRLETPEKRRPCHPDRY